MIARSTMRTRVEIFWVSASVEELNHYQLGAKTSLYTESVLIVLQQAIKLAMCIGRRGKATSKPLDGKDKADCLAKLGAKQGIPWGI